jgi:hypothetical protein
MKKLIASALILGTIINVALADIPNPVSPRPSASFRTQILDGENGKQVYQQLKVEEQFEWALRFGNTSDIKVLRTKDGTFDITCSKRVYGGRAASEKTTKYSCSIKSSLDGAPVPKYKLSIRMG